MIEISPKSNGNIVGVRARGTLTGEDYQEVLIPRLDQVMVDKGKVRFLLDLGQDFHGWTFEALWNDAKFGWDRRNDFEKVALVGGSLWMVLGAKAGALLMSGEFRTFAQEQLQEAWDWIQSHPNGGAMTQSSTLPIDIPKAAKREPEQKEKKPAKLKDTPKTNPHIKRKGARP